MANKYPMSCGTMIEKSIIDRKVREAKEKYVNSKINDIGYPECERTKRTDLALDCSHIISVRISQASGRSELAWCEDNIELLTRDEHMKIESFSNVKRESWYWARKDGVSFEQFINEYED